MSRIGWFIVAAIGLVMPVFAQVDVDTLCQAMEKFPLPKGVSRMGYEKGEAVCIYRYQFGQSPAEVGKFFEKALPKNGWVMKESGSATFGVAESYHVEAVKGKIRVFLSANQAMMMKVLEIRFEPAREGEAEALSAEVVDDLKSMLAQLPVPEGAGRMSQKIEGHSVEVTYQYGGDLKQAMRWIVNRLKKSGWDITKEQMTEMGIVQGGEIRARKNGYRLEVTLAHAMVVKTITYRLSQK